MEHPDSLRPNRCNCTLISINRSINDITRADGVITVDAVLLRLFQLQKRQVDLQRPIHHRQTHTATVLGRVRRSAAPTPPLGQGKRQHSTNYHMVSLPALPLKRKQDAPETNARRAVCATSQPRHRNSAETLTPSRSCSSHPSKEVEALDVAVATPQVTREDSRHETHAIDVPRPLRIHL